MLFSSCVAVDVEVTSVVESLVTSHLALQKYRALDPALAEERHQGDTQSHEPFAYLEALFSHVIVKNANGARCNALCVPRALIGSSTEQKE